jgi:GH25 family lysozyme M1 (1,4-beta-N-acetylmuramidase)
VLAGVLAAVVAAGALAPTAAAEPSHYPVVDGVVRDNVDMPHSPLTSAAFEGNRGSAANADYIRGIDVARFQHPNGAPIDWARVAGSGVRFAGVKATEGDYYLNPYFADDQDDAKAAGLYAFAYHFGTPNDSGGLAQAGYFLERAQYVRDGRTLNPVLDMEFNPYQTANRCYDKTPAQLVAWIKEFIDEVKRRTGVPAILYTMPAFWSECVGNSTAFGATNLLWVAHHDVTTPTVPAGWTNWSFWQYSDTLTVPGIAADEVDGDYFSGTEAQLDALAAKAAGYTAIDPVRMLDTRADQPVGPGGTVTIDLTGQLPETATAAVLNVTGIANATTFVTAWPGGAPRPNSSNLNLVAGEVRPNLVTVQVGPDRTVQLYNNAGNTHLLADLAGYYATDATGLHTPVYPVRVLDTRADQPVGPQGTITLDLSARVPANATAVTVNLTGVQATTGTFVSAWPTGQSRPNVSNLNLANGNATPNLVTVKLGTNRSVNLFNNAGTVQLIADLAGYYVPGSGSKFVAVPPQRLIDTRAGGVQWQPVSGGGNAFGAYLGQSIPYDTTGAVLNVTGIAPTATTYVSVYLKDGATPFPPVASNLNLVAGQTVPNLASVRVSLTKELWFYNNAGSIDLVADLAGYFAP